MKARKKKRLKPKPAKDQATLPLVPRRGPPENVRAAGAMQDRRSRRLRTRAAEETAALEEDDAG